MRNTCAVNNIALVMALSGKHRRLVRVLLPRGVNRAPRLTLRRSEAPVPTAGILCSDPPDRSLSLW